MRQLSEQAMKDADFKGVLQGLTEAIAFAGGEDVSGLKVHVV